MARYLFDRLGRPIGKSRAKAHRKPATTKLRNRSEKTSKLQRLALYNGTPTSEMNPSLRRALEAKGLLSERGRATEVGKAVVTRMKARARREKKRDAQQAGGSGRAGAK